MDGGFLGMHTHAGISFVEENECCEDAVAGRIVIDGSFSQITKKRLKKFVRKMRPCYFPINLEETLVNEVTFKYKETPKSDFLKILFER